MVYLLGLLLRCSVIKELCWFAGVTRTNIPRPPYESHEYWSAKDGFSAIKTEVAVSIQQPHKIIWCNGNYRGKVSDIRIAKRCICSILSLGELALADLGYLGEPDHLLTPIKTPSTIEDLRFNSLYCRQRSVIERVNSRLKIFKIFKEWNRKNGTSDGMAAIRT
jgi:hypothetical protein